MSLKVGDKVVVPGIVREVDDGDGLPYRVEFGYPPDADAWFSESEVQPASPKNEKRAAIPPQRGQRDEAIREALRGFDLDENAITRMLYAREGWPNIEEALKGFGLSEAEVERMLVARNANAAFRHHAQFDWEFDRVEGPNGEVGRAFRGIDVDARGRIAGDQRQANEAPLIFAEDWRYQ